MNITAFLAFLGTSALAAFALFEGIAQLIHLGETFMLGLGILLALIGQLIGTGIES